MRDQTEEEMVRMLEDINGQRRRDGHTPPTSFENSGFAVLLDMATEAIEEEKRRVVEGVGLSAMLARIAELTAEKAAAAATLKRINEDLEHLESLAAEQLRLQGLDGCRAAGRTWWVQDTLRISVPKEARAAVLEAAAQEGIGDELTTVAVPTLKAWLSERAKESGKEDGASFLAGTAFAGTGISEYVASELRSRAV